MSADPAAILQSTTIRSAAVTAFELTIAPDTDVPAHEHGKAHLCLVLDGAFEERTIRGPRWCEPSSWRLSPAGDRHRLRTGKSGLTCLLLEPGGVVLPAIADRVYWQGAEVVLIARQLRQELAEGELASPLVVEAMTLELFAQAIRGGHTRRTERPNWLAMVRNRLHAEFSTPPTLQDLATTAGRHPVQVARVFREHIGCSVGEYVRRLQIDEARRRVLSTDEPLSEIAYCTGFADQSHMTRLLRRRIGATPARLRSDRLISA